METFIVSALVVAVAETGDKTQLLAIVLAARFKQPLTVAAGILAATLANHALAAFAGASLAGLIDALWFRYAIAIGFIAMAVWALLPDKPEDIPARPGASAFLTTLICFFLVEIGDKTQVATIALAARFNDVLFVTAGTTLGMMLANVPAVYLGEAATKLAPLRLIRILAALIFLALGLWLLAGIPR